MHTKNNEKQDKVFASVGSLLKVCFVNDDIHTESLEILSLRAVKKR